MVHVITGGSASGKSEFAEAQILSAGPARRFYIATMQVYGEEGKQRVAKHRAMRAGKGFETIECTENLEALVLPCDGSGQESGRFLQQGNTAFTEQENTVFTEQKNVGFVGVGQCPEKTAVLLECMSNLAANEQFSVGGTADEVYARICRGVEALKQQADLLVIVTNEVFSDGIIYAKETMEYLALLGRVNCYLAETADRVTEVVYGIPITLKGGEQ